MAGGFFSSKYVDGPLRLDLVLCVNSSPAWKRVGAIPQADAPLPPDPAGFSSNQLSDCHLSLNSFAEIFLFCSLPLILIRFLSTSRSYVHTPEDCPLSPFCLHRGEPTPLRLRFTTTFKTRMWVFFENQQIVSSLSGQALRDPARDG